MMESQELFDISAKISKELTTWNPLYNKVKKVKYRRYYSMASTTVPVNATKFWADDLKHKVIPKEDKERIFLQYHRTKDNHSYVFAFAYALKDLCDNGIPIYHKGVPVVDFVVLTNAEFDVGDIYWEQAIMLQDHVTGLKVTSFSTYENFDILRSHGPEVSKRLGMAPPGPLEDERVCLARPYSYRNAMRHSWVAAILDDDRIEGQKVRSMVHIDLCAAAYDPEGFHDYKGSPISLQMFNTPEYEILATSNIERAIKTRIFREPKHILTPYATSTNGRWQFRMLNILPRSVRHFRCFEHRDGTHIEVTPLDYFIKSSAPVTPAQTKKWSEFVTKLRVDIISNMPVGAKVILHGYEQKPNLNGKTCRVHKGLSALATPPKKKRLVVWVPDFGSSVLVPVNCLRITKTKLYSSLEDFVKKAEAMRSFYGTDEDEHRYLSEEVLKEADKEMRRDPAVAYAMNMLKVGKPTILAYSDFAFVNGVKQILSGPVRSILSEPMEKHLKNHLEILEYAHAEEALKLLKLIKMGKQKIRELEPHALLGDGSVAIDEGSDFHQLVTRVQEKIESDEGLKDVFDLMTQHTVFPH